MHNFSIHYLKSKSGNLPLLLHLGIVIVLFIISVFSASAQFDTNYVKKYNRLAITYFKSVNECDIVIQPANQTFKDFKTKYSTSSQTVNGVSLDYDKLSVSFGLADPVSPSTLARKGNTFYTTYGLAFSSKNYRIESSYRFYKGFYDEFTKLHDSVFAGTLGAPYFQDPTLQTRLLKVKAIYFQNKKNRFSYSAAYNNVYRQVRSASTLMIVGNVYDLVVESDRALIPPGLKTIYGNWQTFNYLNASGISVGPGLTFNFVFLKAFYINATGTVGLELQRRFYGGDMSGKNITEYRIGYSTAESRLAAGFNAKNFYFSYNLKFDNTIMNLEPGKVVTKINSQNFNIGYRFKVRKNGPLNRMRESKFYKKL